MAALRTPLTIFSTKRKMEDRTAADMQYGDLTAAQLKNEFRLTSVSAIVDPWTLETLPTLIAPYAISFGVLVPGAFQKGGKLTRTDCANIMFDEMRALSGQFSVYGSYKQLITKMITHWQTQDGAAFQDAALNMALRNQIINDKTDNSTLKAITKVIDSKINYKDKSFDDTFVAAIKEGISRTVLPKFSRFKDNFNGLGITVHDIHAMNIQIISLDIFENKWKAVIKYIAQDHFGLDEEDIKKWLFFQHRFFRIWFVLQRYERFGFKPFFTNMEAIIEVNGGRSI